MVCQMSNRMSTANLGLAPHRDPCISTCVYEQAIVREQALGRVQGGSSVSIYHKDQVHDVVLLRPEWVGASGLERVGWSEWVGASRLERGERIGRIGLID